jgi:O-antigen/teichoic acid export membrane protein
MSAMVYKMWIVRILKNNHVILLNAISLIGTLIATSGLGFVFWWLVAQRFDLLETGLASAAISAMFLLGTIGMMGMGTLLIGELAGHPTKMKGSLIITALIISGVGSAILGLAFALIAAHFSQKFAMLTSSWTNTILFMMGVSVTGMVLVLDQATLGLLRGHWQLWRNTTFAVSKLLFLLPIGYYLIFSKSAMTIYAVWFLGNILSLLLLMWLIGVERMKRIDYRPRWSFFWDRRSMASSHHILNLSLQTAQFSMPVLVTLLLSPEVNASFYVAWLIATSFFVVPAALSQSLYAVSVGDQSALALKIRFTLQISTLGVISGALVIIIMAKFILGFFNPVYALTATSSLQILLLASLPIVVRVHYVAIHQIKRQIKQAASVLLAMTVLELLMAITGARLGGLVGLSLGWVLAIYLEGFLMISHVYRTAFPSDDLSVYAKNAWHEEP